MSIRKNGFNRISLFVIILLVVLGLVGVWAVTNNKISFNFNKRASSRNIGTGLKFLWLHHPQRELTNDEILYISKNYDAVVFGNQNNPKITDAIHLKAINPGIKVYMYFPTSERQDVSINYGIKEFKDSWYLKDFSNQKIASSKTINYVDLTNSEYRTWAISKIEEFLSAAPFDGVFLDSANQIPLTNNWVAKIGMKKIVEWNSARYSYISEISNILHKKNKSVYYNGLNRDSANLNRGMDNLPITDGVLNEYFCLRNLGDSMVLNASDQLKDIKLQQKISKMNKIVFQKVNIDPSAKNRYGKYCYGVFLMGYVPGYGYFKYGEGYNLIKVPDEINLSPSEISLILGNPVSDFVSIGTLVYREFEKMWVVVNLGTEGVKWTNPDDNTQISIPSQDALFIENKAPVVVSSPTGGANISCREFCRTEQSRTNGGWCAFNEKNCAITNADYISAGNKYCPQDRNYCCCRKN